MVAAGPGPSASAGAERAWRDAAAALTDVHRELSGQVRDLPGGWSGGTADGVTAAFGSLDGWVVSAAVDAGRTADALAAQAGLAADLRARMPAAAAPTPPETAPTGPALLDDWAAADLAAGNSAGRAAELMVRYDDDTRVTGAPWTGWGASPVVAHDGTAPASPAVPAPSPGGPPPGPGGDADPAPAGGAASRTTVFAGIGLGGITAAVLTGNGRAGVPGARPIDVGGPSSGPDPADASATDTPPHRHARHARHGHRARNRRPRGRSGLPRGRRHPGRCRRRGPRRRQHRGDRHGARGRGARRGRDPDRRHDPPGAAEPGRTQARRGRHTARPPAPRRRPDPGARRTPLRRPAPGARRTPLRRPAVGARRTGRRRRRTGAGGARQRHHPR